MYLTKMNDGSIEVLFDAQPLVVKFHIATDPVLLQRMSCSKSCPTRTFTKQFSNCSTERPAGCMCALTRGCPNATNSAL